MIQVLARHAPDIKILIVCFARLLSYTISVKILEINLFPTRNNGNKRLTANQILCSVYLKS